MLHLPYDPNVEPLEDNRQHFSGVTVSDGAVLPGHPLRQPMRSSTWARARALTGHGHDGTMSCVVGRTGLRAHGACIILTASTRAAVARVASTAGLQEPHRATRCPGVHVRLEPPFQTWRPVPACHRCSVRCSVPKAALLRCSVFDLMRPPTNVHWSTHTADRCWWPNQWRPCWLLPVVLEACLVPSSGPWHVGLQPTRGLRHDTFFTTRCSPPGSVRRQPLGAQRCRARTHRTALQRPTKSNQQ